MTWWWTGQLWLLSGTLVAYTSVGHGCPHNGLLAGGSPTPSFTIGSGITVKLRPQNAVKRLILLGLLENEDEQQLYELKIVENMEAVWGDMEVTLKDSKSQSNIFKVPWPPIIVPQAWTTLFLHLHYNHLLQIAVIPHEAMEKPRNFVHSQILMKPAAISANLERFGITKLRLKLLSPNISMEYAVNCDQEFLATAFAAEFGVPSSVPYWRSLVWITLGIVGILVAVLIFTFTRIYLNRKKQPPKSFTLARYQSGSSKDTPGPVLVSSTRGGKKDTRETDSKDTMRLPQVTVGVVSSRAPSPGHETDETTIDYVNKAFSCDED